MLEKKTLWNFLVWPHKEWKHDFFWALEFWCFLVLDLSSGSKIFCWKPIQDSSTVLMLAKYVSVLGLSPIGWWGRFLPGVVVCWLLPICAPEDGESQVLVGVRGFSINFHLKLSSSSQTSTTVKEGKLIFSHLLFCEFDTIIHRVELVSEGADFTGLYQWVEGAPQKVSITFLSTSFICKLATIRDRGEPIAQPFFCL